MLPIPEDVRAWHAKARREAEKVIARGGDVAGDAALERALTRVNELSRWTNERVHETVRAELAKGKLVALVGGDHSAPYGAIRAVAEAYATRGGVGILHVDAHADLRVAYEGFEHSHASIMHNVTATLPDVTKLVQVGIRDLCEAERGAIADSRGRIVTHFDHELAGAKHAGETWSAITERIARDLPERVYVSFDVDGLDPSLCPHTGTPVPGGLSWQEATALIAAVVRAGKTIVAVDLNEVVPGPEGDEWDANVGARLLYKMIGWMLVSQTGAR
jgi:agmatinase